MFPYIKHGTEVYGNCPGYVFKKLQSTQTRLKKHLGHRDSATLMFKELSLVLQANL